MLWIIKKLTRLKMCTSGRHRAIMQPVTCMRPTYLSYSRYQIWYFTSTPVNYHSKLASKLQYRLKSAAMHSCTVVFLIINFILSQYLHLLWCMVKSSFSCSLYASTTFPDSGNNISCKLLRKSHKSNISVRRELIYSIRIKLLWVYCKLRYSFDK